MSDEPERRQIVIEIVVFALLFVLVGAAYVAVRVAKDGDRVLNVDPRHPR